MASVATTPMAAASDGVAMPMKMKPVTTIIRLNNGATRSRLHSFSASVMGGAI